MLMKHPLSLSVCLLLGFFLVGMRLFYSDVNQEKDLMITTWDALGYYLYLPSTLIYEDVRDLSWFEEKDQRYRMSGGRFYQANVFDKTGNYVFKYYGGVAVLQLPFFLLGHQIALRTDYPADGFSPPYQYAIGFGAVIYALLGLLLLRWLVLRYFSDLSVALALLVMGLGSNFLQYAAVDGGQSHVYLFFLYALVLLASWQWHRNPRRSWAFATGLTIGLAVFCRPTEILMLFIPLLWDTHNSEASREKWKKVGQHRMHVLLALVGGILALLPQLLYWKYTSGSFVYDVGSKWDFLTPHFQVLLGFEKGWLIYTPLAVSFLVGLFFIKFYPFRYSVLTFCLLNIYVIIAWHDWRYGGSYSTRALVQSYPVFTLALGAFIERIRRKRWSWALALLSLFLIGVNIFQLCQYNETLLHYGDMNRKFYGAIYLNPSPSPLDMSLMDTEEWLSSKQNFGERILLQRHAPFDIEEGPFAVLDIDKAEAEEYWVEVSTSIKMTQGYWEAKLQVLFEDGSQKKVRQFRLFHALSKEGSFNDYAFYFRIPTDSPGGRLSLRLLGSGGVKGRGKDLLIKTYRK